MPMNSSSRHHDLLKAFSEAGCPICKLLLRDNDRDMFNLYQDRINKVETHLQFRAGRGLCNDHAWQMAQAKGGSISVAVMYESTLLELLKHADQIKPGGLGRLLKNGAGSQAADALEPTGECTLCTSMNKNESYYVYIMMENIRDEALRRAMEESSAGICLPHTRMVLRALSNADDVRWLTDFQVRKWHALQDDINHFTDNVRDNIPQEQMGSEGDSWLRAVRYLSGEPGVFGLRRGVQ